MSDTIVKCITCDKPQAECQCITCAACVEFNRNHPNEMRGPIADGVDICQTCHLCTMYADCNCWNCTSCGTAYAMGGPCQSCQICTNCCRCFNCMGCARRFLRGGCPTCNLCMGNNHNGCCTCHAGERVNFFDQEIPQFHEAARGQFKQNPSVRFLAAEIEVAAVSGSKDWTTSVVKKWKGAIVRDGSIPASGFEINSAPANGDIFIQQITEICEALKKQNAKVTGACGLHVHVDARDYTPFDLKKLIFLYSKIEKGLYDLIPAERRDSRYCLPCSDKYMVNMDKIVSQKAMKNSIVHNVYGAGKPLNHVRNRKYDQARYNGLNIHSYFFRKTIENRMFNGTVDPNDIINWALLQASILDFAATNSDDEIKALTGSPLEILKSISNTESIAKWVTETSEKY